MKGTSLRGLMGSAKRGVAWRGVLWWSGAAVVSLGGWGGVFGAEPRLEGLREVETALRERTREVSDEAFELRAMRVLAGEFGGAIRDGGGEKLGEAGEPALAAAMVYNREFGYLRVRRVSGDLAERIGKALEGDAGFKAARGVVLDLRWADGRDYEVAARTAEQFTPMGRPLMDWGAGLLHSAGPERGWGAPVLVLVNRETREAAEALAAVLQSSAQAIVLGENTAGKASRVWIRKLSGGRVLEMPGGMIRLGTGEDLGAKGVAPNIVIRGESISNPGWGVDLLGGGVGVSDSGVTNRVVGTISVRRRLNEAELVRAQREGIHTRPEAGTTQTFSTPLSATLRDGWLARAFDLITGIGVVQGERKAK